MRYRLIAETSFDAPTNAEAKDWFAGLIDLDAAPYYVEISAEEESAKPHLGAEHPAAVATHKVVEAIRLLQNLRTTDSRAMAETLNDGIADRLSEVPRLISEVFLLSIRNERALEELRTENVTMKREHAADLRMFKQIEAKNTSLVARHNQIRATLLHAVELAAPHPVTFAPHSVETQSETLLKVLG